MYYLDYSKLYKVTTKEQRVTIRKTLDRNKMMERRLRLQHSLCFYCADPITMSDHLDHIVPVYYGGNNAPVNLVAACKSCNLAKLTDQIEITNPHTIKDFLQLQYAYAKWLAKLNRANEQGKRRLKRYQPKRVRLYGVYHAELFKSVTVNYF